MRSHAGSLNENHPHITLKREVYHEKIDFLCVVFIFFGLAASTFAADEAKPNPPDAKAYSQAVDKAIRVSHRPKARPRTVRSRPKPGRA